jgi:hypothetical protein
METAYTIATLVDFEGFLAEFSKVLIAASLRMADHESWAG